MKCPRCGNEVSREEAFCGQCGAPNTPPAQPTEMVSAPPPPVGGRLGSYAGNPPMAQGAPRTRQLSGNNVGGSYPNMPQPGGNIGPSAPNQGAGFYHDATEAISSLPASIPGQMPPQSFSQGNYPGSGARQGSYPGNGSYGGMVSQGGPYPTNNFAGSYTPHPPMGGTGQSYMHDQGQRGKIPALPVKQPNNTMVLIVSLSVIVALVSVIAIGAMVILKGRNGTGEQTGTGSATGVVATATPASATAIPVIDTTATASANATATPAIDATPTPAMDATPSPQATTAVAADPGFQSCAPTCSALGYLIEYPLTWSPTAITSVQGYQYTNPAAPDEILAIKAPGQTGSQPGDLVSNDLQTNFAGQPGYTAPTAPATTATIGGTTWLTQTAYYQNGSQQQIRVIVYATVYQQKAYIIELQANNAQFDQINQQDFIMMLKSFAFQAIPAA